MKRQLGWERGGKAEERGVHGEKVIEKHPYETIAIYNEYIC